MEFDASPQLFFPPHLSPTNGPPLAVLKISQPPNKGKFEIFQLPVSTGGSHYAVIATFHCTSFHCPLIIQQPLLQTPMC